MRPISLAKHTCAHAIEKENVGWRRGDPRVKVTMGNGQRPHEDALIMESPYHGCSFLDGLLPPILSGAVFFPLFVGFLFARLHTRLCPEFRFCCLPLLPFNVLAERLFC